MAGGRLIRVDFTVAERWAPRTKRSCPRVSYDDRFQQDQTIVRNGDEVQLSLPVDCSPSHNEALTFQFDPRKMSLT